MITVRKIISLALGAATAVVLAAVVLGATVLRRRSGGTRTFTPKALTESAGAALSELIAAVQSFVTDVRQGMAEHEAALREAAELDGGQLGRTTAP